MQNQEETLASGLQRRVTVLMDSITNGTKVYLPTENILELNLLTNQSYTLVEAENVTILSYKANKSVEDNDINYVWASNDENILKKIDTPELVYGESTITIPEIEEITQKFITLNTEAKSRAKKTSTQIAELQNEYQNIKELEDKDSIEKRNELEREILERASTLLGSSDVEVVNISGDLLSDVPVDDIDI